VVAVDDVRALARDLGRFLDQLLRELGSRQLSPTDANGLRVRQARRERLEHYVGTMTTAQRLRLSAALHLLSSRLDEDLAHPDQRAAAPAASRRVRSSPIPST
jgi:hypothetical protein